jgi:hypothetical protein
VRRWLVIAVTFLGGLYYFLEFFLPKHILIGSADFQWSYYGEEVNLGVRVLFSMALGLGVLNLVRIHGYALTRKRKGWINSAALLVAMFATMIIGLWGLFAEHESLKSCFWDFLFQGLMNNLGPAMFSLLAFYIASAAYRSFRVQNMEAGLMMIAALLVMFGQIPLGFYMWDQLPVVRNWMLSRVSTPAFRGIFFGAAIAALAMGVRMWLSLERTGARGGRT